MKRSRVMLLLMIITSMLAGCHSSSQRPNDALSTKERDERMTTASETTQETMNAIDVLLKEEAQTFLDNKESGRLYEIIDGNVGYVGRWFDKEIDNQSCRVTLASGSSLHFMVRGTKTVTFNFQIITSLMAPYYAVSIDGEEPIRFSAIEGIIELPDAEWHTIDLYADGMTYNEDKWNAEGGYALHSIDVGGGEMVGLLPKGRLILFYGTSAGEGIMSIKCSNQSDGNSAVNAFPYRCCEALDAVLYNVCYGGTGITEKGFFATLSETIDHYSKNRPADHTIRPDIIVVYHGGNDGNADGEVFQKEYLSAVEKLRGYYPDSKLVLMIPFKQIHAEYIREIADQIQEVYLVETDSWNISCRYDGIHPDEMGAMVAGNRLADCLIDLFGENYFKQ